MNCIHAFMMLMAAKIIKNLALSLHILIFILRIKIVSNKNLKNTYNISKVFF